MSLLLALLNTKHLQQKLCNFWYHLKTGKYSDSIIFNDNLGILLSLFESKVKWCDTCFKVNWPTEVSLSLPKGTWLWNSRNCWTPPSTPMPAVFFCIFDFLCVCAWTVQHSYHHHYNPVFLMREHLLDPYWRLSQWLIDVFETLCQIMGISRAYLGHIISITRAYCAYFGYNLGIPWGYPGDILEIQGGFI